MASFRCGRTSTSTPRSSTCPETGPTPESLSWSTASACARTSTPPLEDLPLGLKQRLSLAVAVLHEPDMLLLDEPTSGVDPVARDEFWELLIDLSRRQGVTIFVSTHFMNEALRCDRISLMHAGTVLACDTPARLMAERDTDDLETAFIGFIADAEAARQKQAGTAPSATTGRGTARRPCRDGRPDGVSRRSEAHATRSGLSLGRMLAYSRREAQEIERDPVRLLFAFLGSALMMLAFGFGITTDVENIRFAYLDLDQSPESRAYLSAFEGSRYFIRHPPAQTPDELQLRLKSHEIEVALEVQPNFGRNVRKANVGEVIAWVDGAPTNRAESVRQNVMGVHNNFLTEQVRNSPISFPGQPRVEVQTRFAYNPAFESIYAIVPSVPAILLILIPAILMAVSIVREKELGSIINFYVTPTRRLEFLDGQATAIHRHRHDQLRSAPAHGGRRLRGARSRAADGCSRSVRCCTLRRPRPWGCSSPRSRPARWQPSSSRRSSRSCRRRSSRVLLQPVSTLDGGARVFGTLWPTSYYMHASVGAFTKGLGADGLLTDALALAAFIPILDRTGRRGPATAGGLA